MILFNSRDSFAATYNSFFQSLICQQSYLFLPPLASTFPQFGSGTDTVDHGSVVANDTVGEFTFEPFSVKWTTNSFSVECDDRRLLRLHDYCNVNSPTVSANGQKPTILTIRRLWPRHSWCKFWVFCITPPGSSGGLRLPCPLRTAREIFTSSRSSLSNVPVRTQQHWPSGRVNVARL